MDDGDSDSDRGGDAHDPEALIGAARDAQAAAYVPYSEYRVGAALLAADGTVFTGCNVENANYSNSLHAEEVAVGQAVAAGHREFVALAVSSAARDGVTPCGMCRQTLVELCPADMPVYCDEGTREGERDGAAERAVAVTTYRLEDLLPAAISPETLGV